MMSVFEWEHSIRVNDNSQMSLLAEEVVTRSDARLLIR